MSVNMYFKYRPVNLFDIADLKCRLQNNSFFENTSKKTYRFFIGILIHLKIIHVSKEFSTFSILILNDNFKKIYNKNIIVCTHVNLNASPTRTNVFMFQSILIEVLSSLVAIHFLPIFKYLSCFVCWFLSCYLSNLLYRYLYPQWL